MFSRMFTFSVLALLFTTQLVAALPLSDFHETNDIVSRAQGPTRCSLLDLDDAQSLPGWSKLEQYARSTWGAGEWEITINPPGYRDKPATMCVTGVSKIIQTGTPNCTEKRVDIPPKKKDGKTIDVDAGFTNRGNWNITNVTTAAHAEFFEAHFRLPNITQVHLGSLKAVGAFINAPDNSFVTTATNVTIKSVDIVPVPDKRCIGTILNQQCITSAEGRIQLVASGYIWFNYKIKRAPMANPKGAKHSRYAVKIEDVLKNATERAAYIDFKGYMNTSMRYDYFDEYPSNASLCSHQKLQVEPSCHASQVGYKRPTERQRVSATLSQSSRAAFNANAVPKPTTFPAPLVLPDDDLALDPKCPPQSLRQWIRLEDRNVVTSDRNNVYVAAPPAVDPEVDFMRRWTSPNIQDKSNNMQVRLPKLKDVVDYLAAFYPGMTVKVLPPSTLKFASWGNSAPATARSSGPKTQKNEPKYVGLNASSECIRIRTRGSNDGLFERQLNLDDLLDAAISVLPEDAYALVLLVDHDLYEGPEDEFVCGRAYGGSRVAVISSARYHPLLDAIQGIERDHAWPASHCEAYINECCEADASQPVKKRAKVVGGNGKQRAAQLSSSLDDVERVGSPLHAALAAHRSLPSLERSASASQLEGLWLGRGSGCLKEDARQPPYLCPVDLAKMISATQSTPPERYRAILAFCAKHEEVHLFAAYRAWIAERLKEIEK
ncbi:hypothetical protein BDN70DRAFT_916652 [Pholiota conissans]|uniref:Uncharacterized protein n=1 Tax=Pholiota conissans TaxID=109636 RepID=A0A9P6D7H3_9AGAR|nr:hypothetical protein BDN70DRAFT_916652 [Pholiota conissans]